ncbi:MAG TPA: DUF5666 domain-containing protein [Dehalococcoidia bacterium]|nr:DUF5666 domain-containing protein [Dehalococcoidia bacterium]
MTTRTRPAFEDVLDECLARLVAGEPLDGVLLAHREHAVELLPVLRAAQMTVRAPAGAPTPAPARRAKALGALLAAVDAQQGKRERRRDTLWGWIVELPRRPRPYQALAGLAAAMIFGGAAVGATAAAGGSAPGPVRDFFLGSRFVGFPVEVRGTVLSLSLDRVVVARDGQTTEVRLTDGTRILAGGQVAPAGLLQPGANVRVEAVMRDDALVATKVHIEQSGAPPASPVEPPATSGAPDAPSQRIAPLFDPTQTREGDDDGVEPAEPPEQHGQQGDGDEPADGADDHGDDAHGVATAQAGEPEREDTPEAEDEHHEDAAQTPVASRTAVPRTPEHEGGGAETQGSPD